MPDPERDPLTVLMVAAHPHDVLAQAGGTLSLHARRGDRVVAVVLTSGGQLHTFKYMEQVAQGKRAYNEAELNEEGKKMEGDIRRAASILGLEDVRFLHVPDDILVEEREVIRLVEDVIRDVKPDLIVTHHPLAEGGVGFVHATTGKIVMHAFKSARAMRPQSDLLPHWTPQVFFITPPQITCSLDEMLPRTASVFVDVTDVIHLKVQAEMEFTTQDRWEGAKKVHECMEGYWGGVQTKAAGYCEVFTPYWPELYDALPLSERLRTRFNKSGGQQLEKRQRVSHQIVPFLEEPQR